MRPGQKIQAARIFNDASLPRHDNELHCWNPSDQVTASDGETGGYKAASTSAANLNNTSPPGVNRLLSTPENDAINSKVDRLVAAIEDRRGLRFVPSSEIEEYDVFADAVSNIARSEDEDEIEQSISPWPQNFGRIIRQGEEHLAVRSPRSEIYDLYHGAFSPSNWSDISAAEQSSQRATAQDQFDDRSRTSNEVRTVVRRTVRAHNQQTKQHESQHLVRMGRAGVEQHRIFPIPLDFDKALRALTPSIHSNGSEQDCSSPLFAKSCEAILREANDSFSTPSYDREPNRGSTPDPAISTWLKEIHTPPVRTYRGDDKPRRDFGVFQDAAGNGGTGWKARSKLQPVCDTLKDISNIRRPGYLAFNSFAREAMTVAHNDTEQAELKVTSRGLYGEHLVKSPLKVDRHGIRGLHNVLDNLGFAERERTGNDHPFEELPMLQEAEQPLDPDPERANHLAFTLARLEGRVPPRTPSPILRFSDTEGVYSSRVALDSRALYRRHPFPERPVQLGELVERLEAVVLKGNEAEETA